MIMGDMKHLDAYKAQMPDFIYEVLKEASQFDFAGVPDGKYKIKGCNMNVETSPTEPSAQRKLEGHKDFIDVQYEVEGKEEWIGIETIFDAGKCIENSFQEGPFCRILPRRPPSPALPGRKWQPAASQSCREGAGGMGECEIEVRDQRWLVIAKIERTSS